LDVWRFERIKRCSFCAEEILVAAIKCKHCGSNLVESARTTTPPPTAPAPSIWRQPVGRSQSIFGVFGAALVIAWMAGAFNSPQTATVSAASAARAPTKPEASGPSETQFCDLVQGFSQKYREAEKRKANETELSELRYSRKQAFPTIMGNGEVTGWTGVLKSIATHSDGSANIGVLLSCGNKLRESDPVKAAIKDFIDDNVRLFNYKNIPRGTPLYSTLISLKEGSGIVFSGTVVIDGPTKGYDYVSEASLTETGSMTDPDFTFVFNEIAPDNSTPPALNHSHPKKIHHDSPDATGPVSGSN
jgi:hypothetical protein